MKTLFGISVALALLGAFGGSVSPVSAKPFWTGETCLIDDGYNRYRPCNSGDGF